MSKKFICAILALVMIIGLVPVSAIPASAAGQKCGPELEWSFDTQTLTITGKGATNSYNSSNVPWKAHMSAIQYISLPEGITKLDIGYKKSDYPQLLGVKVPTLKTWAEMELPGNNPLSEIGDIIVNGELQRETVNIPDGTKYIRSGAFSGGVFKAVNIPASVKKIGAKAFANCTSLKTVNVAGNVEYVDYNAFSGCTALTSVDLGNPATIGDSVFYGDSSLSSVKIGSKVTSIGASAFQGSGITSLTMPNTVTFLGKNAFASTPNLQTVTLSNQIHYLEDGLFKNSGLQRITIPDSVWTVKATAFEGCTGLYEVNTNNLKAWCHIDFQGVNPIQFSGCFYVNGSRVKDVVIPADVLELNNGVFKGFTNMETINIPNNMSVIRRDTFAGCTGLTDVFIERQELWNKLKAEKGTGNDVLDNAHLKVHAKDGSGSGTPDLGIKDKNMPLSSEKLVDMVIGLTPFYETSRESYSGSGKYIIGYCTPANKNTTISKSQARNVLRDHLEKINYNLNEKLPGLTAERREALVSFTFHNGYDWLAGSGLKNLITSSSVSDTALLLEIARASQSNSAQQMKSRLCEANLFLNGVYSSTVPATYGYTVLNANGGHPNPGYTAVGYSMEHSSSISLGLVSGTNSYRYVPTRQGYDFIGWYTAAADKQGKLVNTLDKTTNGVTLYAHWQKHDEGVSNDGITGRPVSYKIPAYLADMATRDAHNRVKVYSYPGNPVHTNTIEPNSVMDICAEYRDPVNNQLWVRLRGSDWVKLAMDLPAVEVGTVKLDAMKRLEVTTAAGAGSSVGSLRNGDEVAVYVRQTVGSKFYGKTIFFDSETGIYKEGWIDLTFVDMIGSMGGNDQPVAPEADADSPNGKPAISAGTVVNTDNLNVRAKPNVYGEYYGKLPRGSRVKIYEKATTKGVEWALTEKGWVCMQYVQEDAPKTPEQEKPKVPFVPGNVGTDDNTTPLAKGQIKSNISLNVRENPGPQSKLVTTLVNGSRFSIFQTKMYNGVQWGRMEKGWVCMTYVKLDGDVVLKNDAPAPEAQPEAPVGLGQGRVANCSTHVNVRANATPQSALQGSFPLGTVIDLLEKTTNGGHDWFRTTKGWVCGDYVQKIEGGAAKPTNPIVPNVPSVKPGQTLTGTVSANVDVNVREAAGVQNRVVTTLRSGSKVNIYDSTTVNGVLWYKIDQGWMAGDYIIVAGSNAGNGGMEGSAGTTETNKGQFATATVAQAGLQARLGAGYGYKETRKLNLGDNVTLYEQRLQDGVAWGRISNNEWVNMAFLTLKSTGVTGTGTMGTIYRCGHAVNVRNTPNVNGARMATLLIGSPVEVLETKEVGNGETWGRTPQGWVNMYYVNITGAMPTPPLNPDANVPTAPTTPPTLPTVPSAPEQKPSDQGIPFNMSGMMIADSPLLMVPGVMGDYDASISNGQNVQITKLESVDSKLWGLLDAGWVDMANVQISTFVVSEKAQMVWKDASTNRAVRAINKGEMVTIQELTMDAAQKVWGRINPDEWIELTAITKPDVYSKTFMVKGSTNVDMDVMAEPSETAEKIGNPLTAGTLVTVTGLERDVDSNMWAHVEQGWVKLELITINSPAKVMSKTLIGWNAYDQNFAATVLNQGDSVTISGIVLNKDGVPMGFDGGLGVWIELSCLTII